VVLWLLALLFVPQVVVVFSFLVMALWLFPKVSQFRRIFAQLGVYKKSIEKIAYRFLGGFPFN